METTDTVTPSPDFFCLLALLLFLFFCFEKANKMTYLLGAPQQVCCCCPVAWHYTLHWQRAHETQKPALYPGFPAPRHSQKTLVSTRDIQFSAEEGEVLWHPVGVEAPRAPGLCVTAWEVSKEGICQLYGQGTWNLGTSNHQLAWRADTADTPVPCTFYKHWVNLCGGHQQPEISPTAVKNFIWSLKSQIRSVTVEARFMKSCSLRQSLPSL